MAVANRTPDRPGMNRSSAARGLAGLLGSAALLLALATPASAHNALVSTTPGDGDAVARTPAVVVLTFAEPAIALGTEITVAGPGGPVQLGPARLVDNTVSQDLQPGSPAGTYRVAWRVTSADGHPVSGTFTFTARAAGRERPVTVPSPTQPGTSRTGGHSGWIWAGVGLVAALAAAVILRRFVRRGPDETGVGDSE
jgi:methionine-rich copper-binding protein CopC